MPGGPLELLTFVLLAVLTNTAFPMPFDHVLVWFTSRHPGGAALGYAALGSVCAGAAALIDARLLGYAGGVWAERRSLARPARGSSFYLAAFAFSILPLPFTPIRLALLSGSPRSPMAYAVVVVLGRLPRYLATILTWQVLQPPAWLGPLVVASALPFALWGWANGGWRLRGNLQRLTATVTPSRSGSSTENT